MLAEVRQQHDDGEAHLAAEFGVGDFPDEDVPRRTGRAAHGAARGQKRGLLQAVSKRLTAWLT